MCVCVCGVCMYVMCGIVCMYVCVCVCGMCCVLYVRGVCSVFMVCEEWKWRRTFHSNPAPVRTLTICPYSGDLAPSPPSQATAKEPVGMIDLSASTRFQRPQ
jgi:hypothetical protein